jgi:MFS family permease
MNTLVAPPSASDPSEAAKRLLPWLVAVAFFMESLDTTILNTAVPAISSALGVAPLSMKAVLASYTLSLAVFIPISGWMADRSDCSHWVRFYAEYRATFIYSSRVASCRVAVER